MQIADETKISAFEILYVDWLGEETIEVMSRRLNGETLKQIADSKGITPAAIHHCIRRAKTKLRRIGLLNPELESRL